MNITAEEERFLDAYVRMLYGYKCVRCQGGPVSIHEIVPKSKRPADWWELSNLVPLCQRCHEWSHELGTAVREEAIRELQDRALFNLGMTAKVFDTRTAAERGVPGEDDRLDG